MKYVKPKVFHIASTRMNFEPSSFWLDHIGARNWSTDAESDAERLIEMAGRRCYRSFDTEDTPVSEQNPNLSKVREGNEGYIGHILDVGHGSVIEHAYDTFAIEDCSRVVTHELVRHRLCNFSQESLRFVRPTSLNMYFPDVFTYLKEPEKSAVEEVFRTTVGVLEETQIALVEILGMDDVKKLFGDKKKLQSSMRRLMPIGMATGIIVTANHRNWRHMIEMRTSRHAEEEIRYVFCQIAEILGKAYPAIYQDMYFTAVDDHNEFYFTNKKI